MEIESLHFLYSNAGSFTHIYSFGNAILFVFLYVDLRW